MQLKVLLVTGFQTVKHRIREQFYHHIELTKSCDVRGTVVVLVKKLLCAGSEQLLHSRRVVVKDSPVQRSHLGRF